MPAALRQIADEIEAIGGNAVGGEQVAVARLRSRVDEGAVLEHEPGIRHRMAVTSVGDSCDIGNSDWSVNWVDSCWTCVHHC